jgi:hypothetical protein
MKNSERIPSQAAIGRALGLSPASVTKYKQMGMPVDSVEAALTWRMQYVKPTAHKAPVRVAERLAGESIEAASGLERANELLMIAAIALEAGQSIAAMIPSLREAMRSVPIDARDGILLPVNVMELLTADVYQRAQEEGGVTSANDGEGMTDEEAEWMGDFWYRVAAGEVRLA